MKLAAEKEGIRRDAKSQKAKFEAEEQEEQKEAAKETARVEAARGKATKESQILDAQARSARLEKTASKARLKEGMARGERLAKARNFCGAIQLGNEMADEMCDINTQAEAAAKTMNSKERQHNGVSPWAEQSRFKFSNDHGVAPGTHCGHHTFFKLSGRHVCVGCAQVMTQFIFECQDC